MNTWTETEKADYLMIALKGQALEVACSLSSYQQSSYKEVVTALTHRFGLEKQRVRNRAELTNRKRLVGESVAELGQAVRKLVRRAYPKSGLAFQEDFAVEQFKNALDDLELKRALFQGKPNTLDEAVDMASEAEAWMKAEKVWFEARMTIKTKMKLTKHNDCSARFWKCSPVAQKAEPGNGSLAAGTVAAWIIIEQLARWVSPIHQLFS